MSVLKSKILFLLSEFWGDVLFSLLSVSALKVTDSFMGSLVYEKLLSMVALTLMVINFLQLNYCVSQHGFLWFFKIWGSLYIQDFYVHFFPRYERFSDIVTLNKFFSPFCFSLLPLDSYIIILVHFMVFHKSLNLSFLFPSLSFTPLIDWIISSNTYIWVHWSLLLNPVCCEPSNDVLGSIITFFNYLTSVWYL